MKPHDRIIDPRQNRRLPSAAELGAQLRAVPGGEPPEQREADEPSFYGSGLLGGIAQPGQSELVGDTPDGGRVLRMTLINLLGDDAYAEVNTVVLFATRATPGPGANPNEENETLPLVARATFGTGGTQAVVEVDFVNGAMFSLPGSFLRVDAVVDVPNPDAVPPGGLAAVNAGVFVGYLPISNSARAAMRTLRPGLVAANGNTGLLPIPNFANSVSVLADVVAATYTLEQFQDAAGALLISTTTVPASPGREAQSIPIANAARYVRLTNDNATASTPRIPFNLYV